MLALWRGAGSAAGIRAASDCPRDALRPHAVGPGRSLPPSLTPPLTLFCSFFLSLAHAHSLLPLLRHFMHLPSCLPVFHAPSLSIPLLFFPSSDVLPP
eukprot:2721465-Rhodomonas_salina.5